MNAKNAIQGMSAKSLWLPGAMRRREAWGVLALVAALSMDDTFAAKAKTEPQGRFRFCNGVGDGCTQPGKGYTLCERLLKMLNTPSPDEPPLDCEIKLHPDFPEFSLPKWEEMPVAENMRLIYFMEMYLVGPSDPSHPEWKKYFPHEYWMKEMNIENPETWRRVPYAEWQADYQARINQGEIVPRLYRTQAKLNANGKETLIGYEWLPEGNLNTCRADVAKSKYGGSLNSGMNVFLLTQNPQLPIRAVLGLGASQSKNHLLLYRGKAYFVHIDPGHKNWLSWVQKAMPPFPPPLKNEPQDYTLTEHCSFKLNLKP